MKLLRSRKGFTLIELLVVIGILAVLAVIAIPSVAGLIDRANVSADETNANEYTNAMERFVSEYELYRQDIASGLIKDNNGDGVPDNMDSAQSRVFNVTGAKSMEDIRKLESEEGLNGIRISIDSKYAQNTTTARRVMENYTKTSSSTFEPKQSDMTYWYNRATGYTVVAEKYANTELLYQKLPDVVRKEHTAIASLHDWVDLSSPDINIPYAYFEEAKTGVSKYGHNSIVHRIVIPKTGQTINLNNVYVISGFTDDGVLSNDNCLTKDSFASMDYGDYSDYYVVSIYSQMHQGNNAEREFVFRIMYTYEDNGVTRYFYSDPDCQIYNDLKAAGK